jgi:hypothetical protein
MYCIGHRWRKGYRMPAVAGMTPQNNQQAQPGVNEVKSRTVLDVWQRRSRVSLRSTRGYACSSGTISRILISARDARCATTLWMQNAHSNF